MDTRLTFNEHASALLKKLGWAWLILDDHAYTYARGGAARASNNRAGLWAGPRAREDSTGCRRG